MGHGSKDSSLLSPGCHVSVQNFKEFEHSKFEYSLLGNYEFYLGRLEDRTYYIIFLNFVTFIHLDLWPPFELLLGPTDVRSGPIHLIPINTHV